ncbi:hypothetical protein [Brevundimonas kwangchunensis]
MKRFLATILVGAIALPALAQDTSADWDVHRDDRNRLMVAYVQTDTGLTLALRCTAGAYEALITGLPPAGRAETRTIGVKLSDHDMDMQRWNVAQDDTVAVSEMPAPFARHLRQGGSISILIPGGADDGRNLRYDLTLPASSAAIDETLTRCNRPLVDARDVERDALQDTGLPVGFDWRHAPRPEYPASSRYARGFAVVSCLTNPDGRLSNCEVEAEHPHDAGYGEATLRAVRAARARNVSAPDAPVDQRLVSFRASFVLDGYQTRQDDAAVRAQRQRQREAREAQQ